MENIKELANYCLHCKTKPCTKGCPLGNDIPEFIQCIKEDNIEGAYDILCNTTIFPAVCGRICPHSKQCEGNCVRGIKGEPVQIGKLEAFVGTMCSHIPLNKYGNCKNKTVAIVGSGPSGLNCAAFLAQYGFNVTVFEKDSALGGLLVHGIPEFRLPKETVKSTIQKVLDLGINVEYNKKLGVDFSLSDIRKSYDAVVLSMGANVSDKMNIPGENLCGVFGANELLEYNNHPDYNDKAVSIIGGGNVAMDASRTIKKLGAKKVYVVYRRDAENMPAEKKEIADAQKEGIEFLFQTNVLKILGNQKVEQIECIKTELVSEENCSRKVPINIDCSNFLLDVDYVVMAVGSKVENTIVDNLGLEINNNRYLKIDENYMTSHDGVFAIGDLVGRKATVAWASKTGREAGKCILNYLDSQKNSNVIKSAATH